NNTVEVLDLKKSSHLKSLPGFREPQGIAVVPDAKLVAVANGQGEGVQFVDAGDFHPTKSVRLGDDSDNVRYDASAKRLFVGFGSGALAAISPTDGKVLGGAKLAGHPESFQLERSGSRIFVNVPTADQIAVVDRAAMKVIATWPVVGAKSNFPMALDESNHRVFIGCRRPAKALFYDTTTGKEIGSFEIVGDTDDLFYDAARKRLYVSGGEGFVDVFQIEYSNRIARRSTETIRIDGRLDEAAWQRAESIGPLHQREPVENSEPSEQTVVRVLYDDNALYIAVVCRDRSPHEIVSTQLTRDANLDVD